MLTALDCLPDLVCYACSCGMFQWCTHITEFVFRHFFKGVLAGGDMRDAIATRARFKVRH